MTLSRSDKSWLGEGNKAAHNGNCRVDAQLYNGYGARTDPHTYKELYGFEPATFINYPGML